MITLRTRRLLTFLLLAITFFASVLYDTLYVQDKQRIQLVLVAVTAASFAAIGLLQRYPLDMLIKATLASWPLHLFTACFVFVCFAFHRSARLDQVIVYSMFAYATYFLLPLIFVLDRPMFQAFIKLIAISCALLALPAFMGSLGFSQLWIFPLRNKPYYAELSGITASGGVFEHAEGFAYQIAIGMFCALYMLRTNPGIISWGCFVLTSLGLVISQGRAAIYGVGLAAAFVLAPEIFRRSRLVFLSTLVFALTFPFFIWPALAAVPGLAGYLRIERGLSGRDEAWRYAISVIKEKPWTGHGFMASAELTEDEQKTLRSSGFSGAGTTFHNTFITKAVDLGLIATLIYALLYVVPLVRLSRPTSFEIEETLLRSMLVLIVTTSLFRDYNIGGIRSTAMAGSVFLGLANLWHLSASWQRQPSPQPAAPVPTARALPAAGRVWNVGRGV